jgi:hypothetical protein
VRLQHESERRRDIALPSGSDSLFCRMLLNHTLCTGDRVQRGPNWKWQTQDDGGAGTVVKMLDADGWVGIKWDCGALGK